MSTDNNLPAIDKVNQTTRTAVFTACIALADEMVITLNEMMSKNAYTQENMDIINQKNKALFSILHAIPFDKPYMKSRIRTPFKLIKRADIPPPPLPSLPPPSS
jgi:hypothetical protein